jgi:FkbM family methyltransferase
MSERNVRERLARKLLRLLAQAHDKGARLSYRLGVNNSPGVESLNKLIRWLIGRALTHVESPFDIHGHKMFLNGCDDLSAQVFLNFFEVTETRLVSRMIRRGDVVLDIGANIGFYTLLFARLVGDSGRVYAFEPDPTNFALLEKNVRANGYKNVELVRKALADENGKTRLYLAKNNRGMHRLYQPRRGGKSVEVDVVRLDDYFAADHTRINFVKMDVEGAESAVLRGMSALLRKNRATMLLEFAPYAIKECGAEPEALLQMVRGYGYEFFCYNEAVRRLDTVKVSELLKAYPPEEQKIINLLCVRQSAKAGTRQAGAASAVLARHVTPDRSP